MNESWLASRSLKRKEWPAGRSPKSFLPMLRQGYAGHSSTSHGCAIRSSDEVGTKNGGFERSRRLANGCSLPKFIHQLFSFISGQGPACRQAGNLTASRWFSLLQIISPVAWDFLCDY